MQIVCQKFNFNFYQQCQNVKTIGRQINTKKYSCFQETGIFFLFFRNVIKIDSKDYMVERDQ
jgi:hypothetical protein